MEVSGTDSAAPISPSLGSSFPSPPSSSLPGRAPSNLVSLI
uniref:Uncharacterized protein n=1 Tax=Arundo donax TaxID=35708 RepID=A0A0A9HC52_ARUDO